jgi:hypothetical protein
MRALRAPPGRHLPFHPDTVSAVSDPSKLRRETQLHNARQRYPTDDLSDAVKDLGHGFGTFMEFPDDAFLQQDTATFDATHVGHPLHSEFQSRRQRAASFFWMLAEGDPTAITHAVLPELHRSLFDASAAVRYDLAMCLGHANRPESAVYLKRLIETEPSSQNVRDVARWALAGDTTRRFGAAVDDPAGSFVFRRPEDSEIRRDRMHTWGLGVEEMYYVLWAACAWELSTAIATDLVRDNFAILSAPDYSFSDGPGAPTQHLHTSWQRMFRQNMERNIAEHSSRAIRASEIEQRIVSTLQGFKLWGYHDYYAGHEGGIRLRVLEAMKRAGIIDRTAETVLSGDAHVLGAYYLAFTDYYHRGVAVELGAVPRTDVRAFVSHSSRDKASARRIADALQAEAIKVWLDERQLRVGDSLWDAIGRGIASADFLLLLISPESVQSQWVRRELNAGLATEMTANRKIVLPVLIEPTEVPVFLRERLYCNLADGFDAGVDELVRAML